MIVSMRSDATDAQIRIVCDRIQEFGYRVHTLAGEERVIIGAVGTD